MVLRWTLLVLATAGFGFRAAAATQAQCMDLLQTALDDKNPDTRKQAVVALSLTAESGPLFTRLIGMLQDKDVELCRFNNLDRPTWRQNLFFRSLLVLLCYKQTF
jgi:hypothetical protein